ncbi:MAG: BREX system P-loop protein BrxC, partial [Butyribacter sp.]|nr:BREX system P-loop protein BrxC [Butyribacter sp.]
ALDDVLGYIADNTHMHMKTSMKSIKDRFMKAPYGFVEDDVHWLVAKLFHRGDLALYVNGSSVSMHNKTTDELIAYITKKTFADKLMIEQKVRVSDKEKKITKDIMKELFGTAGSSDDEDMMMNIFIEYANKLISTLGKLQVRYENTKYPGKHIVEQGRKLLINLVQIQTLTEFFQTVAKKQDDLLDFAEDYEPIKAFFDSEQKTIFDKAVLYLSKYDDSKIYIVDEEIENIVSQISAIIKKQSPYSDIPKLPELLKKFSDLYSCILDEQLKPVLDSVYDSQKRVFDVLNTKEYAEANRSRYSAMFDEIIDVAKDCTNVSVLRSYADRAEALKMRLLNEMTQMEQEIALKKAEEVRKRLEEQAKAVGDVNQAQIEAEVQKKVETVKRIRNISIKSMTGTASWKLENTEDVDRYLNELRLKLVSELDTDTIVNIEF